MRRSLRRRRTTAAAGPAAPDWCGIVQGVINGQTRSFRAVQTAASALGPPIDAQAFPCSLTRWLCSSPATGPAASNTRAAAAAATAAQRIAAASSSSAQLAAPIPCSATDPSAQYLIAPQMRAECDQRRAPWLNSRSTPAAYCLKGQQLYCCSHQARNRKPRILDIATLSPADTVVVHRAFHGGGGGDLEPCRKGMRHQSARG